jgi:predicted phosphodiesterase
MKRNKRSDYTDQEIIEAYTEGGSLTKGASLLGVPRKTFSYWINKLQTEAVKEFNTWGFSKLVGSFHKDTPFVFEVDLLDELPNGEFSTDKLKYAPITFRVPDDLRVNRILTVKDGVTTEVSSLDDLRGTSVDSVIVDEWLTKDQDKEVYEITQWKDHPAQVGSWGVGIPERMDEEQKKLNKYLRRDLDKAYKEMAKDVQREGIPIGVVAPGTTIYIPENYFFWDLEKQKELYDNSRILVISDMHIPYHHPDALAFLRAIKDEYEPTRVISVGDEVDYHAMSFHDSDPDLMSPGDELKKAQEVIHELYKLFPKMDIMHSNHGSLLYRRGKHHGIPRHMLKSYAAVLGLPNEEDWRWHEDLTIQMPNGQNVYFHHGKGSNSLRVAQQLGMSYVAGHYHSQFNIQYYGNPLNLHWAMQVGCLIDDHSMAFAYNRLQAQRPIIGTAMIIEGQPKLIPLVKLNNGRWDGKLS